MKDELEPETRWTMTVDGVTATYCIQAGQGFIKFDDDTGEAPILFTESEARVLCRAILGALGERQ